MFFSAPFLKRRKPLVVVAALVLGNAAPALATSMPTLAPVRAVASARIHVAQSQEAAQLAVRIQQLEEQTRLLNGQIEGLTFQLTQMQTLVERLSQDSEQRFQALEGGAPGKPQAATPTDGATPSGALPQDPGAVPSTEIPEQGVRPLPGEAEFDPTFTDGSVAPDALGNSGDPLVGTGNGDQAIPPGTGQAVPIGGEAPALDLSFDPNAPAADTGDADADAQYNAGYEALTRGDYAFAEDQFSQFLELYPDNAKSSDASNWLGESLLQRGAYDEAAEVLLNAFQKAPNNPRAPDLLLKLGISLAGAEERETACRTFAEIDKRYTNLTPAFLTRLAAEKTQAECPPA
ncbi:tol-pal system protein YbgF [uncultured Devosia sp.]|uniref:tol-pal system protein YbgF n=1 Tax=uncultured Devosia sp. TaxID=211434 RepID=UPI0035CAAF77